MGLKDLTLRTTGMVLLVAAATHYIGFNSTRVPESRPVSLERSLEQQGKVKYSGKLANQEEFTFISDKKGELVNLEDERDKELADARAVYNSEKSSLNRKHSDLQKKLRNFEYK